MEEIHPKVAVISGEYAIAAALGSGSWMGISQASVSLLMQLTK